jgi:hypothetical protein
MARVRLHRPHFSGPIVWVGFGVVAAAIVVQTTKSGVDILALLVAAFALLLLERTVGDWVADTLGPLPTALLFGAIAVVGVIYFSSDSGRGQAGRFFAAAEARGYHTAYFRVDHPPSDGGMPAVTVARPGDAIATAVEAAPAADVSVGSQVASADARPGVANRAPERPASGVRLARLHVVPEIAVIGQAIALRIDVSSNGDGVVPTVQFSIDGHPIGTAAPSSSGVASLEWSTRVPGQYVVRARVPSGDSASALVTVLPGGATSTRRRRSVQ